MSTTLPQLKFSYFEIRGRGDAARIALHVGGIPFEDDRVTVEAWGALKPTTPFGQLPMLTINGTIRIAQSNAVLLYVGALAGLYPVQDILKAALISQIVLQIEDMNTAVDSNRQTQDINVKMSQRKHLAEVRYPAMFGALEKVIEEHSSGKWAVGDSISVADVSIYILVLMIKSALWDGIPTDLVDPFARVQAVFEAVRTHPKVLEWETAHPNMKGFAIATAASS